jgi:MOSC domain-containing protein YiiM
MRAADLAELIAHGGVAGDRYNQSIAKEPQPSSEITLIEAEAIEAACREYQLAFEPAQSRRNLVTRGVPLNHLVGREFRVGDTVLRGIRLCEPCSHLEKLTVSGIEKALRHRGGLRAEVIRGGKIQIADSITPNDLESSAS